MRKQSSAVRTQQLEFHCQSCEFFNSCFVGTLPIKNNVNEVCRSLVCYDIKRKGGHVFHQGQPREGVFFLCSGLVKLVAALKNGQEVILDLLSPPSEISGTPVKTKMAHGYSAVVISESARIAYAEQGVVENWIRLDPVLGIALFHNYGRTLQRSYTSISHRIYDVRTRFLLLLSRHMSAFEMIHGGELVAIHLSRDELAQLVQTTPETISRLLHCLRDEGLVVPITGKRPMVMRSKVLRDFFAEHDDSGGS